MSIAYYLVFERDIPGTDESNSFPALLAARDALAEIADRAGLPVLDAYLADDDNWEVITQPEDEDEYWATAGDDDDDPHDDDDPWAMGDDDEEDAEEVDDEDGDEDEEDGPWFDPEEALPTVVFLMANLPATAGRPLQEDLAALHSLLETARDHDSRFKLLIEEG